MTGRQEYDRTKDRQRILGKYMIDNLRGEFDPHRHLRREASVRQYNCAGMFCPQFYLREEHVLIYNTQIN
jgi:hypothetical protein